MKFDVGVMSVSLQANNADSTAVIVLKLIEVLPFHKSKPFLHHVLLVRQ